ncbi:hypothetical protein [Spirosoma endophyticum]|uniref:Peptidase inhibitor family I36 n=1 Tax=Spirosoma endophyticum TaxID=662367 RepID=A0A1I2HNS7_9BACT|nr:hypothetical protein [Spirosoma endophyticum]SFF30477.1 hypothetical protein SAMN05216167_1452 [Spirosoma endophyticum]
MKINKIMVLCLVALTSMAMGLGCHKDSLPPCEGGNCCWQGGGPEFVKRVDGARAEYGGSGFSLMEPISVTNGYESHSVLLCPVLEDMVRKKKLFNNYTAVGNQVRLIDSTRLYRYRVWGIIYKMNNIIGIIPRPTYAISIDRIEDFQ